MRDGEEHTHTVRKKRLVGEVVSDGMVVYPCQHMVKLAVIA